jgi:hypothetical protein
MKIEDLGTPSHTHLPICVLERQQPGRCCLVSKNGVLEKEASI